MLAWLAPAVSNRLYGQVHLHEMLAPMGGIAAAVEMRGNNFSLGQRQLILSWAVGGLLWIEVREHMVEKCYTCCDTAEDSCVRFGYIRSIWKGRY